MSPRRDVFTYAEIVDEAKRCGCGDLTMHMNLHETAGHVIVIPPGTKPTIHQWDEGKEKA